MGGIERRWWKGLQTCKVVSRSYGPTNSYVYGFIMIYNPRP
jgi:hypothetical protein